MEPAVAQVTLGEDRGGAVRFEAWTGDDWHHEAPRLLHHIADRPGVQPPQLPAPEVGTSSVVDRMEVAQHVLWFCAVRVESCRRNALGAAIDPALVDEMATTYARVKPMLAPIDEEAMHEMLGWFMDSLEALAPPGLPQGDLQRQPTSPFARAG